MTNEIHVEKPLRFPIKGECTIPKQTGHNIGLHLEPNVGDVLAGGKFCNGTMVNTMPVLE